ncbi:hypothetical protein JOC93_000785 [Priestia taiwanensis]|nr:hypothetical protein [Priestia taiwanensis]
MFVSSLSAILFAAGIMASELVLLRKKRNED